MKQSTETKTELLLKDLLDAWGASQDSLNRDYAFSDAHHHLPQLIRETAVQFCLTETDINNFLQNELDYDSLTTLDYHKLVKQFMSIAAAKKNI
ncbi:MAG TPA: hypothetical protein ACFE0H_01945 [Elainellaceae cyanobacterium]